MDIRKISSNLNLGSFIDTSTYQRFAPEPGNSLGFNFSKVLSQIFSGISQTTGLGGMSSDYVPLLNKQIETQLQMQVVSMESNVEKSKHETQMAAIRNIRVG